MLTLISVMNGAGKVGPALSQVVGVACGSGSIYALEKGGSAFAWGGGSHGELGIGAMMRAVATPSRMLWAHDVEYVTGSAGGRFGGAVDSQGRLFTFGNGESISHMPSDSGPGHWSLLQQGVQPATIFVVRDQGSGRLTCSCCWVSKGRST